MLTNSAQHPSRQYPSAFLDTGGAYCHLRPIHRPYNSSQGVRRPSNQFLILHYRSLPFTSKSARRSSRWWTGRRIKLVRSENGLRRDLQDIHLAVVQNNGTNNAGIFVKRRCSNGPFDRVWSIPNTSLPGLEQIWRHDTTRPGPNITLLLRSPKDH